MYFFNNSGKSVGEMTVADRGGRFWLGDNDGTGMIEGGVTAGGRGVWRAGPETGGPIELTGLPFAILGKK